MPQLFVIDTWILTKNNILDDKWVGWECTYCDNTGSHNLSLGFPEGRDNYCNICQNKKKWLEEF